MRRTYSDFVSSPQLTLAPIIPQLRGEPLLIDLAGVDNPLLAGLKLRDQGQLQKRLERALGSRHSWALSGYLENRSKLLSCCPQMVEEGRFWHLGLDIIVPLGTALCAPLDAVVVATGDEAGDGNYGGYVLLRHDGPQLVPFYSFYGHLAQSPRTARGKRLRAGQPFAEIGDFAENGNWFHHTHLQVLTPKGLNAGYAFKGYCRTEELASIDQFCPSPLPLFRR